MKQAISSKLLVKHNFKLIIAAVLVAIVSTFNCAAETKQPVNVLVFLVDDLRPDLGVYGHDRAHSPNIDQLASEGVKYTRAYAQQAVCGPSRNSFMSGRRPDRSRSWNFINHFRQDHPEWTSLPGLFLKHDGLAPRLRSKKRKDRS